MTDKRLRLILALYVGLAFVYSLLMPPWEGPDEPAHYILAVNLARVGVFSSLERNYEAGQPQTYYRLASIPLKGLYALNPDWVAVIYPARDYGNVRQPAPIFFWSDENYVFLPGVYLLRWLNILTGAGALIINYAAMKRFVLQKPGFFTVPVPNTEKSLGILTTALALAALTPQFLHTTSSVANDTLGILGGAILFWLLSRVSFERVSRLELSIAFVLAFLLPYTTKLTVLPVGLALIFAIILHARKRRPEAWRKLAIGGLVLGGGALALGIFLMPRMGALFVRQIAWRALSVDEGVFQLDYLWGMFKQVVWSFWGLVGWLQVGLPAWMVVLLTGSGLVGIGAEGVRQVKSREGQWVLWLSAGLAVAAVLKNGLSTPNSQGRFLFPVIGVLALLIVRGWDHLLPARFKPYLLLAVLLLMLLANAILWVWGILPVYYQPFLD